MNRIINDKTSPWFRNRGQRSIFRVEKTSDQFEIYRFIRLDSIGTPEGSIPKKESVAESKTYCITNDPKKISVTKICGKSENLFIEFPDEKQYFMEDDPVTIKFLYIADEITYMEFADIPESIKAEMNMSFYELPKGYLGKKISV